jgi:hypothetical protein
MRAVVRFIAQCHAKGLIYRDIKPGAAGQPPGNCRAWQWWFSFAGVALAALLVPARASLCGVPASLEVAAVCSPLRALALPPRCRVYCCCRQLPARYKGEACGQAAQQAAGQEAGRGGSLPDGFVAVALL